jgi:hypothetical protein
MLSETVTITLSKLIKNSDSDEKILNDEIRMALEEVAKELAGPSVLVEVDVE